MLADSRLATIRITPEIPTQYHVDSAFVLWGLALVEVIEALVHDDAPGGEVLAGAANNHKINPLLTIFIN